MTAADHTNTPAELAERIRTYGTWQGPNDLLDTLVAQAEGMTCPCEIAESETIRELSQRAEAAEAEVSRLRAALDKKARKRGAA